MYVCTYVHGVHIVHIRILAVALVYLHNCCNMYIHTYIMYVRMCMQCVHRVCTVYANCTVRRSLWVGPVFSKDVGNVCYNRRLRRPQKEGLFDVCVCDVCVCLLCVKMVEGMAAEEVQSLLLVKILGMKPGWKETMFQV